MANKLSVAFIGTGIMGAPIAGHIMDAGYELTVYNRTKSKADALVARGATWAGSPADAARDADVVFTMLGYPSDVEDVYLSTDGLVRAAKTGAWLVDLTTSSPQLARDIHDAAEVEDKHAVDCPVTGGEQGAVDGTLTLILGCTEADAAPILPAIRSRPRCATSTAPARATAKLCNQVSLAGCMVGMADALALAQQGGLDAARMRTWWAPAWAAPARSRALAPRRSRATTSRASSSSTSARTCALPSSSPRTSRSRCPVPRRPSRSTTCSARSAASASGTQAISLLYAEQADAAAAGLDWSRLDVSQFEPDGHDGCGCGGHGAGHECCGGHDHDGEHECCGGHGDGCCGGHDHGEGHECCGGHDGCGCEG